MAGKDSAWGFWIPIKDKDSASYAAKMSGLPVFMLGLSFLSLGLITLLRGVWVQGALILLAAIFLLVAGLSIRKEKFALLPLSVGFWIVLTSLSIYQGGFLPAIIINIIIGLLAISGLRGWWWLKQNPE